MLLFAVAVEPPAHQPVIEHHRRHEDQQRDGGRQWTVERQSHEKQQEKHRFAGDRRKGHQHAGDEDQTDGIDVAREDGRVAAFDECQPPIVVVDVETARQVAVEVVDEVPLDLVE